MIIMNNKIKTTLLICKIMLMSHISASYLAESLMHHTKRSSKTFCTLPSKKQKLEIANREFTHLYRITKKLIRKKIGTDYPVIIIKNDDIILYNNDKSSTIRYIPDEYHTIKQLGHLSCGLTALTMLSSLEPNHYAIKNGRRLFLSVINDLVALYKDETNKEAEEDKELLAHYQVLAQEKNSLLSQNVRNFKPLIDKLIKRASVLRINCLQSHLKALKEEMTQEQWDAVSVIVAGPRMPREKELSMLYFEAVLNLKNSSSGCPYMKQQRKGTQRLLYAEEVYGLENMLKLLVTEIADEQMGLTILGDEMAMHKDILGDATEDYLTQELKNHLKKELETCYKE